MIKLSQNMHIEIVIQIKITLILKLIDALKTQIDEVEDLLTRKKGWIEL